jgi:hypothetical protein
MDRKLLRQGESFLKSFFLVCIIVLTGCAESGVSDQETDWRNEIIYHVMPRSFYDSNGDLHGDLNGLREKLDYLEELGVSSILSRNRWPGNIRSIANKL